MALVREQGQFAVELDGASIGLVKTVEGGAASGDVVTEKVGPDGIARKHVTNVHYDDITVTCGTGMSSVFYTWIADTLNRKYARKDGAVVAVDANDREVSRLSFQQALISEITFPALDAKGKDAAYLTVKFGPESTRRTTGQGPQIAKAVHAQKQFLEANFRLDIPGLDCSAVSAVDEMWIRQTLVDDPVGALRDFQREPGNLEIPNLAVVLPESRADSFYNWFDDFVIKGNNGPSGEKNGTLAYLAPTLKAALFTLDFHGLGIFKLTPLKVDTGRESVRLVRAEMYCEEISFEYDPSVAWEPPKAAGQNADPPPAPPAAGAPVGLIDAPARPADGAVPLAPVDIPADLRRPRPGPI